jgi:hypothetical protein
MTSALSKAKAEVRRLKAERKELRSALMRACGLALDAAQIIDEEGVVDPEDNESNDLRHIIDRLQQLLPAKQRDPRARRRA